jgi:hypothetical protein
MREVCYALVVCDASRRRLAVQGSCREPFTRHGRIAPAFHRACASLLALYPDAACIEAVSWREGVQVEQAPVLAVASRTERAGLLTYQVMEATG